MIADSGWTDVVDGWEGGDDIVPKIVRPEWSPHFRRSGHHAHAVPPRPVTTHSDSLSTMSNLWDRRRIGRYL
jgi:hypothetical protein